MDEFRKRWPEIKQRKRTEIHVNSFTVDVIYNSNVQRKRKE
jgi:hypothetical protein